jgi:hypothetical protein
VDSGRCRIGWLSYAESVDEDRLLAAEWEFERSGEGYIYYPGPHSRGIRVTAAEREVFIHGTTDDWLDIIDGRARTEPARPYWPTLVKAAGTADPFMLLTVLGTGLFGLVKAYQTYDGTAFPGSYAPVVILALAVGGSAMVLLGVVGLWGRWRSREGVR